MFANYFVPGQQAAIGGDGSGGGGTNYRRYKSSNRAQVVAVEVVVEVFVIIRTSYSCNLGQGGPLCIDGSGAGGGTYLMT